MDGINEEAVANFVAITGGGIDQARTMLEATNFDLSSAVDLYFASTMEDTHAMANVTDADAKLARELAAFSGQGTSQAGPGTLGGGDPEVRAPIPIRKDRLYGEELSLPHHRHARAAPAAPMQGMDAFRDFRAESSSLSGNHAAGSQGLASLFEPPRDLMFTGDFDAAKAHAQEQARWLLVNVQTNNEFASHMLNRDTWADETVKSVVKGSFVFYQVYDAAEMGSKVVTFYRLGELPAILVIDPVTGAMLRHFHGFIEPERLVEELVPFMDHSIHDPAALRLANPHQKRQRTAAAQRSAPAQAKPQAMSEEDELAMALAMSMDEAQTHSVPSAASVVAAPSGQQQQGREGRPTPQVGPTAANGIAEQPAPQPAAAPSAQPQKSAAEVAADAAASLPPEPPAGDASGCRIAVRLPDGRRLQRRFNRSDPLAAVQAFCVSQSEEAASGKAFVLAHAGPGASAPLSNLTQSLQEAGAADAMLQMRWAS